MDGAPGSSFVAYQLLPQRDRSFGDADTFNDRQDEKEVKHEEMAHRKMRITRDVPGHDQPPYQ